jgi:hypothetical protein
MAFERFKTVESLWSLWNLIWGFIVEWGIQAAVFAMLGAIGFGLYSAGSWINSFGPAGWVVAFFASVILLALVVGLTAWAWERVVSARLKGRQPEETAPADVSSDATAKAQAPEFPLQKFTAALQKASLLEHKFDQVSEKIEEFIAETKIRQDAREKLVSQMRSSLNARRQLEQAEELFAAIDKAYSKVGDADKLDLENFTSDNNIAQSLMRQYYNDFLKNTDGAKDLFRIAPNELSPSFWANANLSQLIGNAEIEHQFKTSRLWYRKVSTQHNELRIRCNRLIDA